MADESATGVSVMEDPSAQAIARTYADALLDAVEGHRHGSMLEELGSFVDDVLLKVPGLREVFNSLVIGRDEKIRLIDQCHRAAGLGDRDQFLASRWHGMTASISCRRSCGKPGFATKSGKAAAACR